MCVAAWMSDSLSTLIEISLKAAAEAVLASSSLQPANLKARSSTTNLRCRVPSETNIDNRSCLELFSQPGFLLVKQGNGVLHKLIHGLAGLALNVLLDHFFQLRSQMNLYDHSLPQVLMPQPE